MTTESNEKDQHKHEWVATSVGPVHPSIPRHFCPLCGTFAHVIPPGKASDE